MEDVNNCCDDSNGDVLENRYKHSHVGGAYNAKDIKKPKDFCEILKHYSLGRFTCKTEMVENGSVEPYTKHTEELLGYIRITNLVKPPPEYDGTPGIPIPLPFIPTFPASPPPYKFPTIIYWNTDSDDYDQTKIIGQTYWNF